MCDPPPLWGYNPVYDDRSDFTQARPPLSPYSGRDCVKSLRSSYTGLYPQTPPPPYHCWPKSGTHILLPEIRAPENRNQCALSALAETTLPEIRNPALATRIARTALNVRFLPPLATFDESQFCVTTSP